MLTLQTHTNKYKQKQFCSQISETWCRYLKTANEAFFNGSYPKHARKLGGRKLFQSKKTLTVTNNISRIWPNKRQIGSQATPTASAERKNNNKIKANTTNKISKIKFIIYHIQFFAQELKIQDSTSCITREGEHTKSRERMAKGQQICLLRYPFGLQCNLTLCTFKIWVTFRLQVEFMFTRAPS